MVKVLSGNKKWFFLIILILVLPAFVRAQSSVFDKLRQNFDSGEIFKAQLNHEFIDSYTHDTVSTDGDIWIGEKRYKIILKDRYILVDSVTSKVYNAIKNQLIISQYDPKEDDYAPSRFLSGSEHSYTIHQSKIDSYGYLIKMTSTDPFSIFKQVEIEVTNNYIPKYIKTIDQTDNKAISRFSDGKFVRAKAKMFTITYPKNAEVIDMRK
jgi:outer membrane lipoprotein-sorting protein